MAAKDNDKAIVVFTADTLDKIVAEGGSGDWVLSPAKANACKYLICCRKQNWSNRRDGVMDRSAFLIGLIAGLHERPGSENDRGQPRFLIEVSDIAVIQEENVWKKGRNPVTYSTLNAIGIDPKTLKFKPLSKPEMAKNAGKSTGYLTIAEAKKGLAISFGVSPDDIEITIRG